MRTYELLAIIKPNLDIEEVDKVVAKLEETIAELGGKALNTNKMGRKKLAYDINKYKDGFYTGIQFEMPAENVEKFKRNLKLNESVIRSMIMVDMKEKANA